MQRQTVATGMENLLPGKIRKRGCSSSASSSSSVIRNYRFKRAILARSKRAGSSTPVPTWKLMMRSPSSASALRTFESPRFPPSQNGSKAKGQQPVSARKLAATLWEMNEIPSPSVKERIQERRPKKEGKGGREKVARSGYSGSLPPHLYDPSHSPVSERIDRSGTGSHQRRSSSIFHRLRQSDHNIGVLDSISNTSFMEVETRSHVQTPTVSVVGGKTRLKDVSNALTTSKELLKIINRMWAHEDRPPSSMSLISALHAELERARLQVNQLIQEQRSEQNDINYMMKCFAEEKAAWKNKEAKVIEAAIESVAGELDVERKRRRRSESLNKKLGKELAETKASLLNKVKELQNEKRVRMVIEKVCDELARDISEDKAEVEEMRRVPAEVCEEVEKEREMLQLADVLREERVQMKLSEAKYHLEEKNAVVNKLRSQLETVLGTKRPKGEGLNSLSEAKNEEIAALLNGRNFGNNQNWRKEDDGEVEDNMEHEEESSESDLQPIELNMDNNSNRSYKLSYAPGAVRESRKPPFEEQDIKGRKSTSRRLLGKSTLQRSISDGVDWCIQNERLQNSGDELDWDRFGELEKQAQGSDYVDEMNGYKSTRGIKEHHLAGSRVGSSRNYASPVPRYRELDRPPLMPGSFLKSRLAENPNEGHNPGKSGR